jgi:hypothetical protein
MKKKSIAKAKTRRKASVNTVTPDFEILNKRPVSKEHVKKLANSLEAMGIIATDDIDIPLKNIKWLSDSSRAKLNYLAGINRPINPSHVTTLAKSLAKMGCVQPVVTAELDFISGKKELYIIDGQHKFNALMRLGRNIPYVIIKVQDKRDLVQHLSLLNASSKSWSMQDYVRAWSSLSEHYIKLNQYFERFDVEIRTVASILSGFKDSGSMGTRIKNGEFKIVDEAKNLQKLSHLTDALKVVPRMNRFENRYFINEYLNFLASKGCEYNHVKFLTYLQKNKEKFILATQEQGKLTEFFQEIK